MSRRKERQVRRGVYVKPNATKTSIIKQAKAAGVKIPAGKSISTIISAVAPALGMIAPPLGAIAGIAGQALGAIAPVAPIPGVGRRTYSCMIKDGRVVSAEGRTIGYTRKKAKKMFGRRRRRRWTKRDEMEWEYKLRIAQASQPVVVK